VTLTIHQTIQTNLLRLPALKDRALNLVVGLAAMALAIRVLPLVVDPPGELVAGQLAMVLVAIALMALVIKVMHLVTRAAMISLAESPS
jgi:hypothetical protein